MKGEYRIEYKSIEMFTFQNEEATYQNVQTLKKSIQQSISGYECVFG